VTIDLLHEYTHVIQDDEAEQLFARRTTPHAPTREDELQREIGARREQVYFGDMLRVLREPVPTDAILGDQLSNTVFRGRFERERAAPTARERRAATSEIRTELGTAYSSQLAANSSIKTYQIGLTSNNHAELHWDLRSVSSPRDLGEVPATIRSTFELGSHLERTIRALPEFGQLFNAPGRARYATLTFMVVFDSDLVTEFGMQP
jgi:GAF domain-containing protein